MVVSTKKKGISPKTWSKTPYQVPYFAAPNNIHKYINRHYKCAFHLVFLLKSTMTKLFEQKK